MAGCGSMGPRPTSCGSRTPTGGRTGRRRRPTWEMAKRRWRRLLREVRSRRLRLRPAPRSRRRRPPPRQPAQRPVDHAPVVRARRRRRRRGSRRHVAHLRSTVCTVHHAQPLSKLRASRNPATPRAACPSLGQNGRISSGLSGSPAIPGQPRGSGPDTGQPGPPRRSRRSRRLLTRIAPQVDYRRRADIHASAVIAASSSGSTTIGPR